MGGFVALDCAIRYPQFVSKLVLESTSAFCSARSNCLFGDWHTYLKTGMASDLWFRNVFYWIFSKHFFEDQSILKNAIDMAVGYPFPQTTTAFGNQIEAIADFNCRADLGKITSKTFVIWGGEDLLFPQDENTEILSAIPEVAFSVLEEVAHLIHMEKP